MQFKLRKVKLGDEGIIAATRNLSREFLHDQKTILDIGEVTKWLKETDPKWWIIKKDKEKIGYIRTSDWDGDSVFVGMDLHPKYRGNGYASIAYKMLFCMLKEDYGMKHLYLEVLESNKRAMNLYADLKFEVIDEREIEGRGRSFKMYRRI